VTKTTDKPAPDVAAAPDIAAAPDVAAAPAIPAAAELTRAELVASMVGGLVRSDAGRCGLVVGVGRVPGPGEDWEPEVIWLSGVATPYGQPLTVVG